jgi:hypothetical protein
MIRDRHAAAAESDTLRTLERELNPGEFAARAIVRFCEPMKAVYGVSTLLDVPLVDMAEYVRKPRPHGTLTYADVHRFSASWDYYLRTCKSENRAYFELHMASDNTFVTEFFSRVTLANMFVILRWDTFIGATASPGVELFWDIRAQLNLSDDEKVSIDMRHAKRRKLNEEQVEIIARQAAQRKQDAVAADKMTVFLVAFADHWRVRRQTTYAQYVNQRKLQIARRFVSVMKKHVGALADLVTNMDADEGYIKGVGDYHSRLVNVQLANLDAFIDYVRESTVDVVSSYVRQRRAQVSNVRSTDEATRLAYTKVIQQCNVIQHRHEWYSKADELLRAFGVDLGAIFEVPKGFDDAFTKLVSLSRNIHQMVASDCVVTQRECAKLTTQLEASEFEVHLAQYNKLRVQLQKDASVRDVDALMLHVYDHIGRMIAASGGATQDTIGAYLVSMRGRIAHSLQGDGGVASDGSSFDEAHRRLSKLERDAVAQLELRKTSCAQLLKSASTVSRIASECGRAWDEMCAEISADNKELEADGGAPYTSHAAALAVPQFTVDVADVVSLRTMMQGKPTAGYQQLVNVCAERLSQLERASGGQTPGLGAIDYRMRINAICLIFGNQVPSQAMPFVDVLVSTEHLLHLVRLSEVQEECGIPAYQPLGINAVRVE